MLEEVTVVPGVSGVYSHSLAHRAYEHLGMLNYLSIERGKEFGTFCLVTSLCILVVALL